MSKDRFERQIRFFGEEGQNLIRKKHVAIVGVGGIGSHVVQQLAFLGIGHLSVIDPDELEETNRNRLVGSCEDDPIPGTKKVDISERVAKSVDSAIVVTKIAESLLTEEAFTELKTCDYVFGCVDNDGTRLVLNELCLAYDRPYLDLASGIEDVDGLDYGGRVFVGFDKEGCVWCYGLLSEDEISAHFESSEAEANRESVYGVSREFLDETGPSVISIDGVIASLAVTEFVAMVTQLRQPKRLLNYRGHMGIVSATIDNPSSSCPYCTSVRGTGEKANVERYLNRT